MYSKQSPHVIALKEGEETYICQCGKTSNTALCDGSHKQTNSIRPLVYMAEKNEELYVCGCGKSANMPWCDGSHKK